MSGEISATLRSQHERITERWESVFSSSGRLWSGLSLDVNAMKKVLVLSKE